MNKIVSIIIIIAIILLICILSLITYKDYIYCKDCNGFLTIKTVEKGNPLILSSDWLGCKKCKTIYARTIDGSYTYAYDCITHERVKLQSDYIEYKPVKVETIPMKK